MKIWIRPEAFVVTWQMAESKEDVMRILHIDEKEVEEAEMAYRQAGVKLKELDGDSIFEVERIKSLDDTSMPTKALKL